MSWMIRAAAVVVAAAGVGLAADPKDGKPTADPKGTPLELRVTGKKTTYPLGPAELGPAEYRKQIKAAVEAGGRPPAPPAVDLTVEVKNTSDRAVQVWTKGDPVALELELKGEGALNVAPQLAFTTEFRGPVATEIAPGKTVTFPVKSLTSGFRGASKYSYWTAPGKYQLVAKLKTGMQPPPKGAKDFDGFGVVTLTSAPFEITVEK